MPFIRIPEAQWEQVWRTLVASGPISRISQELIYSVSEQQIRLLRRKKLPFDLVAPPNGNKAGPKYGSSTRQFVSLSIGVTHR
jgi:hypothetical protein